MNGWTILTALPFVMGISTCLLAWRASRQTTKPTGLTPPIRVATPPIATYRIPAPVAEPTPKAIETERPEAAPLMQAHEASKRAQAIKEERRRAQVLRPYDIDAVNARFNEVAIQICQAVENGETAIQCDTFPRDSPEHAAFYQRLKAYGYETGNTGVFW